VLVQAFPRTVCGQDGGRLSRCCGRTKQFASLKQTSARQRERQFGAGPLRASLTPWLHSSAFPRAHHRRNSPTDAVARALMRHRPPRSASARSSTRGVGQTLTGGRRRAPSPASAAAGPPTVVAPTRIGDREGREKRCGHEGGRRGRRIPTSSDPGWRSRVRRNLAARSRVARETECWEKTKVDRE
jgi:hypothetical protein